MSRLTELFHMSERATNASTVLLPWLPSRDRRVKSGATKEMHQMFAEVLKVRRQQVQQGTHSADGPRDAMQVLMEEGCSDNDIVQVNDFVDVID